MRTHVDTAAAVRLLDTELFATVVDRRSPEDDIIVHWEPMCTRTTFFDENDDELLLMDVVRLAQPRRAEIVRVSRVIDVLDIPVRQRPLAVG